MYTSIHKQKSKSNEKTKAMDEKKKNITSVNDELIRIFTSNGTFLAEPTQTKKILNKLNFVVTVFLSPFVYDGYTVHTHTFIVQNFF